MSKKIKISTIWEDFDIFLEYCESGKLETLHQIKIIKTYFNENGEFDNDWDKLLTTILSIFVNDKRVAKRFNYTENELATFQAKFNNKYSKEYKETYEFLLNKLSNQFYKGVQWCSATKYYEIVDNIYLTKKLPELVNCKITHNSLTPDIFNISILGNELLVIYENFQYKHTINLSTGRKTQISKYKEIIFFINAKYYKTYINNLSYINFKYLALSFVGLGRIELPANNNGYLSSITASSVILSIKSLYEYFESADKNYENIQFTYELTSHNKFAIIRPDDESIKNSIMEDEKEWGELRSANGSRKGRINKSITKT